MFSSSGSATMPLSPVPRPLLGEPPCKLLRRPRLRPVKHNQASSCLPHLRQETLLHRAGLSHHHRFYLVLGYFIALPVSQEEPPDAGRGDESQEDVVQHPEQRLLLRLVSC